MGNVEAASRPNERGKKEPVFVRGYLFGYPLPPELEMYILSYLSEQDLCTASEVCRQWRQIMNDESLWKELCCRRLDGFVNEEMLAEKGWKGMYRQLMQGGARERPEEAEVGLFGRLKGVVSKSERRVLLLGLDNAGKSTMLFYVKARNPDYIPTIGFSVETIEYKGIYFTVWDLGGQQKIRALWRHYMPDLSGVIFMVDSTDVDRFEMARDEIDSILKMMEQYAGCPLVRMSVLVLANKQDSPEAKKPYQVAAQMRLHELFGDMCWRIEGCSALKGENILESLDRFNAILPYRS